MSTPRPDLARAEALGIRTKNADGSLRSTSAIFNELNSKLAELTAKHVEHFKATAEGKGTDTLVAITGTDWKIQCDEPADDGGTNKGPNPMQHYAAALVSCELEQCNVIASEELKINVSKYEFDVEIMLNLDGFMGVVPELSKCFQAARVDCVVHTEDGTQEQIDEMHKKCAARCPIRQLLKNSGVAIVGTWEKAPGQGAEKPTLAKAEGMPDGKHVESFKATAEGKATDTMVTITGTDWKIQTDEPTDDGGTNKGPNPMQEYVAALTSCELEQCNVIASEELKINVSKYEFTVDVALNLDGFVGVVQELDRPFLSATIDCVVHTEDGTQEQIDEMHKKCAARCPIRQLLRNSGVEVNGTWKKA